MRYVSLMRGFGRRVDFSVYSVSFIESMCTERPDTSIMSVISVRQVDKLCTPQISVEMEG